MTFDYAVVWELGVGVEDNQHLCWNLALLHNHYCAYYKLL